MNKPSKTPYRIRSMFSSIAPRYDLLNRLLSLGRDRWWRRFAVRQLPREGKRFFLDAATGTGDIAIEILRQQPEGTRVMCVDFSERMLDLARGKVRERGLHGQVELELADVTSLPFDDGTFDAAIIAFGIRNLQDYRKGIQEMTRVVREGGRVVILEFTSVQDRFFRSLFRMYLTRGLPLLGGLISGSKNAYSYLSDSVLDFPDAEEFKRIMEDSGLRNVNYHKLTFSIVTVHVGIK